MTEQQIQQQIRLALGRGDVRLWRNNVGKGWQGGGLFPGQPVRPITKKELPFARLKLRAGDLVLRNPRRINFGLCEGSSDLIGLSSFVITPEMVGQHLAVFTSLEVKSKTGRPTKEQKNYLALVQKMGGVAALVRSVEEAERALRGPPG